ncbi:hypothetical protein Tco_0872571 [Tanacetum coccineum]
MTEIMEQYMSKTRNKIRSGVARPIIDADIQFELKGQSLKELCDNTFSGSKHEDANKYIKKVQDIVDLFHVPKITQDQLMLRAFPVSLTGAASRWLRNEPAGLITTLEGLKTKFLNKYYPPARASIKTLELQIGQMSKVLQEKGFGSLPSSTETNRKDQVKSISTAIADLSEIRRMKHGPYAISGLHTAYPRVWDTAYGNLQSCMFNYLLVCSNSRVTCEEKAKRCNSGTKMKIYEEICKLLPYAISSKEDTAYQRQLSTRNV